jgi:hypothetical protein
VMPPPARLCSQPERTSGPGSFPARNADQGGYLGTTRPPMCRLHLILDVFLNPLAFPLGQHAPEAQALPQTRVVAGRRPRHEGHVESRNSRSSRHECISPPATRHAMPRPLRHVGVTWLVACPTTSPPFPLLPSAKSHTPSPALADVTPRLPCDRPSLRFSGIQTRKE